MKVVKCPVCETLETNVVDSRLSPTGDVTRRRRECPQCENRFTTYERVEESLLVVVKKDGKREKFDRQKILAGLVRACEKRPVSLEQMEAIVVSIVHQLRNTGHGEITSDEIGNLVIDHLGRTDEVAYVRFASVYKEFKDVSSFAEELKILQQLRATVAPKTDE